jgi:hypothetical protein
VPATPSDRGKAHGGKKEKKERKKPIKLRGLSLRANYTDQATVAKSKFTCYGVRGAAFEQNVIRH